MEIRGISALVTGGASGLGYASASRLVGLGARVTIADASPPEAAALAGLGSSARAIVADVTDSEQMDRALQAAAEAGPVRAVVHCAGRGGDQTRIIDKNRVPGDLDAFTRVVHVNLIGTYNVLRLAAAHMSGNSVVDGDRGAIVLTSSVAAFDGQIGQTSYTASKAGVHGLTLVAARDLASWQIRVNSIAPGVFNTPMLARLSSEMRDDLANAVPHPKRLGQPDDFAHMVTSLLENSYMNGETVRLDGSIRMGPR
jgi:NAD(P)-dependent dehydrogenase (short-subunit alcohol dehydrogenase family)